MGMYAYSDKTQLTKHFNVREFRCKCSHVHNILIDEQFVNKLEKLVGKLNASKAIVSSGHRCAYHDKAVGGNGSGPHVSGLAADICFYAKDGTVIPTDIVSCVAQDLGFLGIANINKNMSYIHLDMKTRIKPYRGDERFGYNSVTTDFYKYYNVTKEQIAVYTGDVLVESVPETKEEPTKDAEWDYQYDEAIANLQKILNQKGAKLHVDGKAGPATYAACRKYTIHKGDQGPLTKWVQQRLNDIGFDAGVVDGIAEGATMKGIAAFQKANKLGTGYLGGKDWYYLIR